jgi:hypothetical protein
MRKSVSPVQELVQLAIADRGYAGKVDTQRGFDGTEVKNSIDET